MPQRKTYPIGKWDIDIPYLNPFGSQNNYSSVKYLPNQYQEFQYINNDNIETSSMTSGDAWQLQVDWADKTIDPFDDLMLYVFELGGEFYRGPQEDKWVIHAKDNEGHVWWGVTTKNSGGYLLTVYKQLQLRIGETVTFKTDDFKESAIYFMTENEEHKYQSIKVALADGEAQVFGRGAFAQGQYIRNLYYNKTLYAYKTKNYALNDIPQDTSTSILWKISWNKKTDPKEISFTLEDGDEIDTILDGERLGALKVNGGMLGRVSVEMSSGVSMKHPELNLNGDKTPEGDTLFWLPSGYWNVVFRPEGKNETILNTRLIPVNSGEMTVVDIKPLINNSYNHSEVGNSSGDESLLKMEKFSDLEGQAKISFMLLDSSSPKFAPTPSNTEILEGGQPGKILKLERIQTPPSVVLALDSSGSMAGAMGKVLASARTFIQGLPENTHIQVIDFDSEIRLLKGTNKEEVIKSLEQVKAKGNTALYDSIVQGLNLLKDKERSTLVVFSDGVDSNAEKKGTGSKASKQEVEKAVQGAGIPLFTIGFGSDHDASTLLELASMSEGTYYSAKDAEVLNHVFTSINDRIGNHFEVTYERPREQAPSDVPVISLTLDVSGSMDMAPTTGEGDFRLDKVKSLFHEFIKQIPGNSLMQLASFSSDVKVDQVFTNRKPEMLQALGNLVVRGGTDIFSSTEQTYKSLKKVPSDKRVMVYLTDAALDVNKNQKELFEKLLANIKDDGIIVLWVGLGTGEAEDAFKWAAEKSGGKYVISEDPDVLAKAFQEVLAEVKQKPAKKASLSLSINNDLGGGNVRTYSDSQLADFPALNNSSDKIMLNTITYQAGIKIQQYDSATSSLVYGRDIPGKDVKIYKRLPLNVKGVNQAMEWTAREIYYLKQLKGVDAPANKSFMAVDMEMKNIHPEGAKYVVPDFASHFFVSMNESGAYPASTATWLTEGALAPPGESAISMKPDETVRGVLVFLVPDENTEQASIHFYDTSNGHITLALVGTPQKEEIELASLPKTVMGKLSDTFSMTVVASSNLDKIEDVALTGKNSVFKVIEAELNSKVQAHLKLNPQERFFLNIKTGAGPFMIPVHIATALLPHGFLRPVTMGAGSSNKVRFAFQTPNVWKDMPMELYGDLNGGAMILPIHPGESGSISGTTSYQGDGAKVTVNALARTKSIGDYVVLDITVADTLDKFGSNGFRQAFTLVSEGDQLEQDQLQLYPAPITNELLLGIDDNWTVFDGASRRGLLLFAIPPKQRDSKWTLQSSLFSTLKLPVTETLFKEESLLVKKVSPKMDKKFDIQLSAALQEVITQHRALATVQSTANNTQKIDSVSIDKAGNNVPAPLPSVHGMMQMNAVKTMADFQSLMEKLKWLPSPSTIWYQYRNSPESVLTQEWGTEGDQANLVGGLLAKLGFSPSLKKVTVTDRGREALRKLGNVDEVKQQYLPAWAYTDEQGKTNIFVVPFMKSLTDLRGLVYLPAAQEDRRMTPEESKISVYFKVEPKKSKGLQSMFGNIADALTGDEGSSKPVIQEVRVLDTSLPLDQLGNEALDVRVGGQNGLYTAVLENQRIQIVGKNSVDPSKNKVVGIRIEVQLAQNQNKWIHETTLQEGEDITGVFHTLAINVPDMSAEAATTLQRAADREYQAALMPDDHSSLIWYTRNILYRFVTNQTIYEKQLAKELDVTAGRAGKERILVVTVRRKDAHSPLRTSVNLLQSANQLHRATQQSAFAFNIMSGLYASRLEGAVLPGNNADFMEVWTRASEDTQLFLSLKVNRKEDLKYMEQHGFPEIVIQKAKDSNKAILIPNKSIRIYGEDRWAWLEIDPNTYETIAVMDTGEHGGFAEYVMALEPVSPSGGDYQTFMAGALVGVSTSIWSVSSFSLQLDDYEKIIKAAKAYTYGLGEVLSGMMDSKDLIKLEYSMGPVKVSLEDVNLDYLAKYFEDVQLGKDWKPAADILGFSSGFKAGAAHYFKQAEKFK